jgi:hypothetical protein
MHSGKPTWLLDLETRIDRLKRCNQVPEVHEKEPLISEVIAQINRLVDVADKSSAIYQNQLALLLVLIDRLAATYAK